MSVIIITAIKKNYANARHEVKNHWENSQITHRSVVGSIAQLNGCFSSIIAPVFFSLNCPGFSI